MVPDQPHEHLEDEKIVVQGNSELEMRSLHSLPFAVQLQNIHAIEIMAKRFPVSISNPPATQLNLSLEDIQVDNEHQLAQVILNVRVECADDPPLFEIFFKLLGLFKYDRTFKTEMIHMFLEQGSLSVMLPFAREFLLSLCTRLQIPPLLMPLLQLTPYPQSETEKEIAPE